MAFRVSSFLVESESLRTPSVELSRKAVSSDGNYFTVVIGNNGTGKSRFVSNLVEAFRDIGENRRRERIDYSLGYFLGGKDFHVERRQGQKVLDRKIRKDLWSKDALDIPSRVVAISTSLSDKFSVDGFNRRKYLERRGRDGFSEYYTYLGPRSVPGSASARALMDRAVTTLIANVGDLEHNRSYRHIFDYLNYEPVVKLSYEIGRSRYFQERAGLISGSDLRGYVKDQSDRRGGMRGDMFKRELECRDDFYWDQMARAYNYIYREASSQERKPRFSFVINFSTKNEARANPELSSFQEELYSYLEDLRRFDLVLGPSITLFKIEGGEFDFSDASSGEASILSTLIALIPNLENDSLIVIDEPEISLHPSWQSKYVDLIDRLISQKAGCHVVIATHSHFLVSDLPLGRSSVIHFREGRKSEIDVDYIDGETNGLSAEDVLLNVFDMPSTRNFFLSKNISEALELVASGKSNSERYRELVGSFERYLPGLKDVDPLKDVIRVLLELGE